ncbi:unnamed protein product [Adineta ricciae]|uniref:Uncharacterized protein n=1 Tax=Adineta ricciae TaxID=249248 RepID=A0A815VKT4_ADIRI|nr:unnamed protein product [Adineta ricciae]
MANSANTTKKIRNVGMDKYNSVAGSLASTGANTCVAVIVFFHENNNIFIEHRNSFPQPLSNNSMKRCLQYVASHIDDINHTNATISSVFILGGVNKSNDVENKQSVIENIIKENDIHDSSTYSKMIKNIKLMNAAINLYTKSPNQS